MAKKIKEWIVTVKGNPNYCGKGAGEAQFAHGKATVTSKRLADWYKEHAGYTVEAVEDGEKDS